MANVRFPPIADIAGSADYAFMDNVATPAGVLTRTLVVVYLGSAAVSALVLLWVLIRICGHAIAGGPIVPVPPVRVWIGSTVLMLTAKIASRWAYRKDKRSRRA